MAPGVVQNSNPVVNNQLDIIESGRDITCPPDHFVNEFNVVKEKSQCKKIRPKVLKNHESRDYLYDRLYNHPCPRVVSRELLIIDFKLSDNMKKAFRTVPLLVPQVVHVSIV